MTIKPAIERFHRRVLNYNLFIRDENDYEDDDWSPVDATTKVKRQIYATWIYVFLFTIFVYTLVFIALINPEKRTVTVSSLTPSLFDELQSDYGVTLSCACTTVAASYKTFVSHTIAFHPVCSSKFVSREWVEAFYLPLGSLYPAADVRTTASSHFELLSALCTISNETVFNLLSDINYYQLVSVELLRETDVQAQVAASIDLVRSSTSVEVTSFINFLKLIYRSSYLVSALGTNAQFSGDEDATYFNGRRYHFANYSGDAQLCEVNDLVGPAYFLTRANKYYEENDKVELNDYYYQSLDEDNATTLQGFSGGCFPLDALLASTLQCLYDAECLSILPDYFPGFHQSNLKIIEPLPSSGPENISINNLVSRFFVDNWSTKINYAMYFDQCAPSVCTYSTRDPTSFSYTITLFFSFYGGLTAILRLIAPFLINALLKLKSYSTRGASKYVSCLQPLVYLTEWMKRLNLFKQAANRTVDDVRRQRIITRCYLFFFTCSIVILVVFTSLDTQTTTMVVSNPSPSTYRKLQTLHTNTLQCACSNSTMSYGSFVTLSLAFHQICSSALISNAKWISLLLNEFRAYSSYQAWIYKSRSYFQIIATFCEFANETATYQINNFLAQTFAATNVLKEDDFNTQINTTINQFIESIATSFNLFMNTTRVLLQADQPLMVSGDSNVIFNSGPNNIYEGTSQSSTPFTFRLNTPVGYSRTDEECQCAHNKSCQHELYLIEAGDGGLPGIVGGCYLIDSVLFTTLESFFTNSTYIDKILSFAAFRNDEDPDTLNLNIHPLIDDRTSSRFPPTTSLLSVVKAMFIEQRYTSFSFDRYYRICSPSACKYTLTTRTYGFFGVLLKFVSMVGGLSVALRMITPILVNSILNFFKPKTKKKSQKVKFCSRIKNLLPTLLKAIVSLNMFPVRTFGSRTDHPTAKRLGQWSTRLYILLLAAALAILTFSTLISSKTFTKTHANPSLDAYKNLISIHGNNLQCPCSRISFPYNRFLQINAQFHPICSSSFVSDEYRSSLLSHLVADLSMYSIRDYRRFLSSHLQLLKGLCELSVQSANQAIETYLSSLLISDELLPTDIFEGRMNQTASRIKLNAPITLSRLLSLLRVKAHGDKIVSTYGTNYQYIHRVDPSREGFAAFTKPVIYDDNCSCALNFTCTISASFNKTQLKTIQGLKMGCTPSESFLASTIQCFSSSSCIHLLDEMTGYERTSVLLPLNMTGSRFVVNATVIDLAQQLFVEGWFTETNYSKYFNQCSPSVCSHTYIERVNLIYTVTYILGLFGGLTIVLKWICPRIVSFVRRIFQLLHKRKTQIKPVSNTQTIHIQIDVKSTTPPKAENPSPPWFYYAIFYCIVLVVVIILILIPIIYKYQLSGDSLNSS